MAAMRSGQDRFSVSKMGRARLLVRCTAAAVIFCGSSTQPLAQSGSFLATLGSDTVQIERFERRGNRLSGIVVTRSPTTRIVRYAVEFDASGKAARYEMETQRADGTPLRMNAAAGSMTFAADSITRETLRDGSLTTQRIAAPNGVVPGPTVPFLGTSYLLYELAHAQARALADGKKESAWYLLSMLPQQTQPQRAKVWLVAADSAESDYFGAGRIGYKFDGKGQLLRSDWSGSTYKYQVRRGPDTDVLALARVWDAADRAGKAMGALSLQDTVRAIVGGASLTLTYSRPAKRGRVIWGGLVPWDKVWRFGADYATHFTTSSDLTIGDTSLPAGRYTLWMLPSSSGASQLIVNTKTNIFGTQYDQSADFARVPLRRIPVSPHVERFTVAIGDGRVLIRWDDAEYSAPISVR